MEGSVAEGSLEEILANGMSLPFFLEGISELLLDFWAPLD